MKKIFYILLIIYSTIVTLGCNKSKIVLNTNLNNSIFQTESFIKIETKLGSKVASSGSGFVVKRDLRGSYILTADHVCRINVQLLFISLMTNQEITLNSKTYDGKTEKAKIIKRDKKNDLCLVYSEKIFNKPVQIANKVPKIGELVYLIGAPKSFSSEIDKMVPVILLVYNGHMTFKEMNNKFQIYSGSVIPGVSGGMIVNKEGKVIGMSNFSWPDIQMGAGTRLEAIKNILKF